MLKTNNAEERELFEEIRVVCPTCNQRKELKIPSKIINQSKQLTTVSIPSEVIKFIGSRAPFMKKVIGS